MRRMLMNPLLMILVTRAVPLVQLVLGQQQEFITTPTDQCILFHINLILFKIFLWRNLARNIIESFNGNRLMYRVRVILNILRLVFKTHVVKPFIQLAAFQHELLSSPSDFDQVVCALGVLSISFRHCFVRSATV